MRIAAFVVLAVVAVILPAAASPSTEEIFRAFDLLGTWSDDCTQQASPEHPRITIVAPSPDVVIESHDVGADYETNRYSVLSAERVSATRLAVEVIFQPGAQNEQRQRLEFFIRSGTRRTMFNQPEGDAVRVKNGVALAHHIKTPVLKKCE